MSTVPGRRHHADQSNDPQIHISFSYHDEFFFVRQAWILTGRNPRQVLVSWALQVLKDSELTTRLLNEGTVGNPSRPETG